MRSYSREENCITMLTSRLFDPKSKQLLINRAITVDTSTGSIVNIYQCDTRHAEHVHGQIIDLRGKTVLPGLVDAHTHVFLHPYSQTPSLNQMRDESSVERILRASNHAKAALLAGYTSYRDLGTEGLYSADVGFRDAINRGIIPGPRLFVATETIASSGGYDIRQENNLPGIGTTVPRISDPADGVDGVRAAVRRRIGMGADVIKFYADYRKRALRFPSAAWPGALPIQHAPPNNPLNSKRNPNIPLFTQEEMNAMVQEAKVSKAPIAAHAQCPDAVMMAARAGVTTIEHGFEPSDEALKAMRDNGTIFVPTLSVMELAIPHGHDFRKIMDHTRKAHEMGIKIAAGGDTGAFAHGDNAREIELLVQAGLPVEVALQAATLHGWEACGGDLCGRKFGWWEEGVAADIIALDGDPCEDIQALRRIDFVMKDGKVYKEHGIPVNFL